MENGEIISTPEELLKALQIPLLEETQSLLKDAIASGKKYFKYYHDCQGDSLVNCSLGYIIDNLILAGYRVDHHIYRGWFGRYPYLYISWN